MRTKSVTPTKWVPINSVGTEEHKRRLAIMAKRQGCKPSQFVRWMIEQEWARQEAQKQAQS